MCEKAFLWYLGRAYYDTACGGNVCSLCCQFGNVGRNAKGKNKLNESTSKVKSEMSKFSLITAGFHAFSLGK